MYSCPQLILMELLIPSRGSLIVTRRKQKQTTYISHTPSVCSSKENSDILLATPCVLDCLLLLPAHNKCSF